MTDYTKGIWQVTTYAKGMEIFNTSQDLAVFVVFAHVVNTLLIEAKVHITFTQGAPSIFQCTHMDAAKTLHRTLISNISGGRL